MSIPTIASYPMPSVAELPAPRLSWPLDASRAALLIHDMQDYFLDFYDLDAEPIPTLVANLLALRERCDALGIPVFYTAQPGRQAPAQRGLLTPFWGPGVSARPDRAGVHRRLAPRPHDLVLDKWRYSAFQRSPLESRLRELGRDQLIIGGIYAHIGILMTAGDAFMRDIQPCVVADAVADFSAARHALATELIGATCGVVTGCAQLLASLPEGRAVTQRTLRERVAALLEVEPATIGGDDNLLELGLDSIRVMSLVVELQEDGFPVSLEQLAEDMSLCAWEALLSGTRHAA
jgi:bifunctional isochorismate lyase/aryl carrier protein